MRAVSRRFLAAVLAIGCGVAATAQSPAAPLTDDQVRAALAAGKKFKPVGLGEGYNVAATGFSLDLFPPAAWISMQAKIAEQEKRTFGFADVTPEMRSNVWHVKIWPSTPRMASHRRVASSVTDVVLRDANKANDVQPTSKESFEFKSIIDSTTYTGLVATFPGEAIDRLAGPARDREIVFSVTGDHWKYDFHIKKKHFDQLK